MRCWGQDLPTPLWPHQNLEHVHWRQPNSSLWAEVNVLTSLFLPAAWLLLMGRGAGRGEAGCREQLAPAIRELDLTAHLFLAATAAGPLALDLRSVYRGICLVALGTVGPPGWGQCPNLSFHH